MLRPETEDADGVGRGIGEGCCGSRCPSGNISKQTIPAEASQYSPVPQGGVVRYHRKCPKCLGSFSGSRPTLSPRVIEVELWVALEIVFFIPITVRPPRSLTDSSGVLLTASFADTQAARPATPVEGPGITEYLRVDPLSSRISSNHSFHPSSS